MFLPVGDLLQPMLRRAQEPVRGAERLHRMGGEQPELAEPLEHRQETPVAQRRGASAAHHLERLRGELDLPDPPGTVLHAVLHALAGDLLLHHRLQRAQRLQRAEVDVAPVHERTQPLEQLRRQHHVAADRAGADQGVPLPVAAVGLVVLLERVEAEHERALGSERTQPHVDAVDEAVRGRLAEHPHELARELEEEAVVVDAAPSALGLSVLGKGEDEVDVRREVQLARAELAERQDDELLGLRGVSDRGPEVGALPLVEPVDARADDRVREVRSVADVSSKSARPPMSRHAIRTISRRRRRRRFAIRASMVSASRAAASARSCIGGAVGGRGQGRGVRRPEVAARDEIREHRRVQFAARGKRNRSRRAPAPRRPGAHRRRLPRRPIRARRGAPGRSRRERGEAANRHASPARFGSRVRFSGA